MPATTMLAPLTRRWLSRPKPLLLCGLVVALFYFFLSHRSPEGYSSWDLGSAAPLSAALGSNEESHSGDSEEVVPTDDSPSVKNKDDEIKAEFEAEYEEAGKLPGAFAIYGNTLATLDYKKQQHLSKDEHLTATTEKPIYTVDEPYIYNPYPDYNSKSWLKEHAEYSPCEGPFGGGVDDLRVFKGHPHEFPDAVIGSYDALGMDGNLCYERDTRLGPYGFMNSNDTSDPSYLRERARWEKTNWGELQEKCVQKNRGRYNLQGSSNPYLGLAHQEQQPHRPRSEPGELPPPTKFALRRDHLQNRGDGSQHQRRDGAQANNRSEPRTALLLRTYTGKKYSDNDKQVIRSLISELSLRTGGVYQIYLFVHVKDNAYAIWDDEATYQYVLRDSVPREFKDMSILWNDEATQSMYPQLDPKKATVHVSQWLSVQKFAQEFPEFDYIWNWELDARVTGHNYDFVEKLAEFSKKQPRRGLWERNERYYIPSVHGDYDTEFRKEVEKIYGDDTVWGAPELPFVSPVGPKPPTSDPKKDNYQWGVGEEADLITVAPIFNPEESGWVGAQDLWGFNDTTHPTEDLPRRTTIVTHSRISKRLLDIMHVENLRGNHISSEMATQTTALLHSLKAVYAPMPIWFDRPWEGKAVAKWFNGGRRGESGGIGCAMGWGREGRYRGTTWYYRANPPQRLYLNWMGWEDTDIGGPDWEETHGRPCLPPMMLHPIKDVVPTEPGYKSESKLPYD
jgi:hypothetical protein